MCVENDYQKHSFEMIKLGLAWMERLLQLRLLPRPLSYRINFGRRFIQRPFAGTRMRFVDNRRL